MEKLLKIDNFLLIPISISLRGHLKSFFILDFAPLAPQFCGGTRVESPPNPPYQGGIKGGWGFSPALM